MGALQEKAQAMRALLGLFSCFPAYKLRLTTVSMKKAALRAAFSCGEGGIRTRVTTLNRKAV